jgi:hypothetical protein
LSLLTRDCAAAARMQVAREIAELAPVSELVEGWKQSAEAAHAATQKFVMFLTAHASSCDVSKL